MKVRTAFPQIWFGSANLVGSGTGWRSRSYTFIVVYLDDMVIHSPTLKDHLVHHEKVFKRSTKVEPIICLKEEV